jgi:hypothetical protein
MRTISILLILSYAGFLKPLFAKFPLAKFVQYLDLLFLVSERDFMWSFRKPKYFLGLQPTRSLCPGWVALDNADDLQPCTRTDMKK